MPGGFPEILIFYLQISISTEVEAHFHADKLLPLAPPSTQPAVKESGDTDRRISESQSRPVTSLSSPQSRAGLAAFRARIVAPSHSQRAPGLPGQEIL